MSQMGLPLYELFFTRHHVMTVAMSYEVVRTIIQKLHYAASNNSSPRSSIVYAVRGRRVCLLAFAELFGLNAKPYTRHAKIVTTSLGFSPYQTRRSKRHVGHKST